MHAVLADSAAGPVSPGPIRRRRDPPLSQNGAAPRILRPFVLRELNRSRAGLPRAASSCCRGRATAGRSHAPAAVGRRSEHHDAVVGRGVPSAERAENGPGIERKVWTERLPVDREDLTVRPGVRGQKDESVDPRVALLQRCSSLDCLEIAETRLRLDRDRATIDSNPAIERAEVAGRRKWDLGCQEDIS
jgi:hypothetical protein